MRSRPSSRYEPYFAEVANARGNDRRPSRPRHTEFSPGSIPRRPTRSKRRTSSTSPRMVSPAIRASASASRSRRPCCRCGVPIRIRCRRPSSAERARPLAAHRVFSRQPAGSAIVLTHGRAVDGLVRPFHADRLDAVPRCTTTRTGQRALHARLQRSEGNGSLNSAARSAEQTDIAYFYSENFLAQWNRALRAIATQKLRRTGDHAAAVRTRQPRRCGRHHHVLGQQGALRVSGARSPAKLGKPPRMTTRTPVPDPAWQPLINNPNYPDYTSGANNITGAMMRTLAVCFGTDRMTFEVTSNAPLAVKKSRVYRRFSAAADDVVNARIWLGIHFRFADLAARNQGDAGGLGLRTLPAPGGTAAGIATAIPGTTSTIDAGSGHRRAQCSAEARAGRRAAWCCASAGTPAAP